MLVLIALSWCLLAILLVLVVVIAVFGLVKGCDLLCCLLLSC